MGSSRRRRAGTSGLAEPDPAFAKVAVRLVRQVGLSEQLRRALRLQPDGNTPGSAPLCPERAAAELQDVRQVVDRLVRTNDAPESFFRARRTLDGTG